MGEPHFDREALIAEVAKRHKILLDPDDPAFALITINEIVLSRAIGDCRGTAQRDGAAA